MEIAVLREAGGLGDMVMTEPVVRGLRTKYPGAEIVYAGLRDYEELVGLFSEPPDIYLAIDRRERRDRDARVDAERWPYLRVAEDADVVVDLFCPAFRHERAHGNETHRSRIECFCEAGGVVPTPPVIVPTEDDRLRAEGYLAARGWRGGKGKLIALAPWSCGKRRTWAKEHWAALAGELLAAGHTPLSLHAFAAPLKGIPGPQATGLGLGMVAALLAQCDAAVTNDSGLLHLAAAVGIPTLSLWGSTNPAVTLAQYPKADWLWRPDAAAKPARCKAPCYSMQGLCDYARCRNGCVILNAITVRAVMERIEQVL